MSQKICQTCLTKHLICYENLKAVKMWYASVKFHLNVTKRTILVYCEWNSGPDARAKRILQEARSPIQKVKEVHHENFLTFNTLEQSLRVRSKGKRKFCISNPFFFTDFVAKTGVQISCRHALCVRTGEFR